MNPAPLLPIPSTAPSFWERNQLRCIVLVLLGIAARLPALQGAFLWDDHLLVPGNPMIKSPLFVLEAFRHYLFPDAFSGHYRPVQTVSYIFDYFLWNTDPFGYHLSNIFWHVASGVLLYLLLQKLIPELVRSTALQQSTARLVSATAFFVALLWMVHPVHSAAIDYISGRADSLVFFFSCAGWLLYLRARATAKALVRRGLFGIALLSGLLALGARESGLMWILVFLIFLFGFDKKLALRTKLLVLAACLALVAVYFGLRQLPLTRSDNIPSTSWSPPMRVALMLRALGDYERLMIFPTNLHVERTVFEPARVWTSQNWLQPGTIDYLAIGGLLLLGAFCYGARRRGPGQSLRVFGASWFFVTYLPISNLFSLNATVAEHWLYLPSVGFLLFLAGVVIDLPVRWAKSAGAFACVAALALGARSIARSNDWVDPETFFRRTFAAGGTSSRIGVNLGVIYAQRGEQAKAEAILRKVLQVSPDYPLARNNLALALTAQGKTEEAEALFQSANAPRARPVDARPRTWDAALHLAQLRFQEKDAAAALAILVEARRDFPGTWELINYEATLRHETQGPDAALQLVQDFAREHWWHFGASMALARLYAEKGESEQAEAALRQASRLDVHNADALSLLARLQAGANRLDEAYRSQQRAVARQPDQPRQYLLLARILEQMGRVDEARQALVEVGRLQSLAEAGPIAN